ncbi:MAG: M1 family aminopeptidase [Vicinamibacterales bacterium]
MGRALLLCVLVLWPGFAAARQAEPRPDIDEDTSIQLFLDEVQAAILGSDRDSWVGLISPNADREQAVEFFDTIATHGLTRVVVHERDRSALPGTLPGLGYRVVAEVFLQSGPRGRIATWRLDIRRPRGERLDARPWRIIAQDRLAALDGLHHLSLEAGKQYAARDLAIRSIDFTLQLPAGDVFVAETAEGVTGLVLLGNGTMRFTPKPPEEQGQVRIFAGSDAIETPFTAAFVRINPFEFDQRVQSAALDLVAVDARQFRKATEIFEEENVKSFSLDLTDLSQDTWSLLPQAGDFLAEVRTRRYDTLTYARSTGEPEDVTLFQRDKRRNIALYASEPKLSARGRFYDEDDLVEFDVLNYDVDAVFEPDREWLTGRARLKIRVTSFVLSTFTLKLGSDFTVNSVVSDELGRLLFLRVKNQNSIAVNLPGPVGRDFELTLNVSYQGRITSQAIDSESIGQSRARSPQRQEDIPYIPPEPNWLFSNRTQWYPQSQVTDYASATLRITVPQGFSVVGSGLPVSGTPVQVANATESRPAQVLYAFQAVQPVRYLGVIVSPMKEVDWATVALPIVPPAADADGGEAPVPAEMVAPPVGARNTVVLRVEANPRQEDRGREALPVGAEILQLYASIVGDVPYDSMTLAMVEHDLPGGHSPGYFAVINNPLPTTPFFFRNDPATFDGFPEFFLAHEIAHQWWGQAVGWKNYHEQWLSEGFAQYFAALYARQRHGEDVFREMLKDMRRWAMNDSDQGPIYLGYRLGHIKGEPKVFRAIAYNKGAMVLHMLRRLLGDETFFAGIRRYYAENRFRKAGTDDFRRAMAEVSGRDLDRFFERWVYGATLPRVRMQSAVDGSDLVVRAEQGGDQIFDVPVTVTITYTDNRSEDVVVAVTDRQTTTRIPLTGAVKNVEFNKDNASLVTVERR